MCADRIAGQSEGRVIVEARLEALHRAVARLFQGYQPVITSGNGEQDL
jgi:hypothetical protein